MPSTTLEQDTRDLAGFGYRQRLDRTLGGFSAFAASFSYLSVLTGSSQLFHVGYGAGGPAFFWTWPVVFLGQFLVALCFAELAARYPISGGVYQWSKSVGSGSVGWMAGWIYLACAVITLASVALALQTPLPQVSSFFQIVGNVENPLDRARNAVILACLLVVASTWINAVGVRLLARINNVGVFAEMVAAVLLIGLLAWSAQRSPAVVFDTQGRGATSPLGYLGPALAASLMASFVLYGFDTAGSLAEETDDPKKLAPRAILWALGSVGIAGSALVFVAIRAAPDLNDPELSRGSGGLPYILKGALGSGLGTPFLIAVVFSIVVCTLTVHATAVRLMFSMARDGSLPFARALAKVHEGARTPTLPAFVIGVAACLLLAANVNFPKVVEVLASVSIVWANLAYLFVTVPMLIQRIKRPEDCRDRKGFSLGRWGLPINALAVLWGVGMVVNIGWPRPAIYGEELTHRYAAPVATLALVLIGFAYDKGFRRHRAGILDEHKATNEFEFDTN